MIGQTISHYKVLDKLGELAKSKAGQFMMKPKKDAAPEVKK